MTRIAVLCRALAKGKRRSAKASIPQLPVQQVGIAPQKIERFPVFGIDGNRRPLSGADDKANLAQLLGSQGDLEPGFVRIANRVGNLSRHLMRSGGVGWMNRGGSPHLGPNLTTLVKHDFDRRFQAFGCAGMASKIKPVSLEAGAKRYA